MVLTANDDYSVITIQSDNLTDFSGIDTVTLTAKINCAGSYSDTIVEADVTLLTGTFTIDLATLFGSADLDDSVYSFTLTIVPDSGNTIYENACLFVDNETRCLVADCVKNTQNINLQLDYYILSRASTCSNCDCETLCNIYQRLLNGITDCQGC